jgi:hypothetical protein
MSTNHTVHIEVFAERHYLRGFRKRYKSEFDIPWRAFMLMLQKFELILDRAGAHKISNPTKDIVICKLEFKVLPNESAKVSGNRCIVAHNKQKAVIKVLMVYCKNDVRGNNETVWWTQIIKKNYPEYVDLL